MPDFTDKPGYAFDPGPPPEASRFLRNKGLKPAFSWMDVEPEEHAVAFSVAKAMDTQLLQEIRDQVQTALDQGQTFAQFRKELRPKLEKAGWWGRKEMVDPDTGEVVEAQLGSPRRLKTIYRANLRSARAAGQWERIERTSQAMPYLEYRLGPSERHRPHHADKEYLVLPWDDPFWSRWYPPNGWGCKCWVRQLTQRQAEERGISEPPEAEEREVINRRTGEVRKVPVGIDPGWDRNPGRLRAKAMEDHLVGELDAADPDVARAALRDIATSWRAQRVLSGNAGGAVPIALLDDELRTAMGSEARVVRIDDSYGAKVSGKSAPVTPEVLARVADAIDRGPALLEELPGRHPTLIVKVEGDEPWRVVLKHIADKAEIWVQTIHRIDPEDWDRVGRRETVRTLR